MGERSEDLQPAPEALLVLDAAGAVVHATVAARSILGIRASDLLGRALPELVEAHDRARVIAWLGSADDAEDLPVVLRRRAGSAAGASGVLSRRVASPLGPIAVTLQEAGVLASGDDDTATLRSTASALALENRTLQDLTAALAHDLRTQLMSLGMTVSALVRMLEVVEEPVQERLAQLLAGVARLDATIEGTLRAARAGGGLQVAPVDCDDLVARVVQDLAAPLEETGGQVHVGRLGWIVGDPAQLTSVFVNLLENAMKYRHPERPLRVVVDSQDRPEDHQRAICVADNGLGIAPGDRARVLQIYQRGERLGARPGSGVGLAACRRIVEAHGGSLWIAGDEGAGTTVCFTLPGQARTT